MESRSWPGRPEAPIEGLEARLAAKVRFRFSLDAETFARRVREIAREMAPAGSQEQNAPLDRIGRLSLDDLYLATACAAGEEQAWEELSRLHFGFIRDFALRCARRDPPASDVAGKVIAELWERGKIAQYAGRSALRTWIGTVVAHTALNALKADQRGVPLDRSKDRPRVSGREAAEPDGAAHERFARLAAHAVLTLSAGDRLLLLLYYEQGMTLDEMGCVLRSSKAALSRRLKRVRERLRAEIDARARLETAAGGEALRVGIDLARVPLDLSLLLKVKSRPEEKTDTAV